MATLKLNIPEKRLVSPSSWGSRTAIANMMKRITKNYGKFIKFSSENSKIPAEIIASFIAVESGGKADAGTAGHITQGLMQWNRNYAKNTLEAEKRLGRLSQAEEDKLKSFGLKFDANNKLNRAVSNADQLKPELNILIGSIYLGLMFDSYFDGGKRQNIWGTDENGNLRLDRVIAVYNAGPYGDAGKKARLGNYKTPYDLANDVNPITSAYIRKIYGINGSMDVATSDVKAVFRNLG
jgi:hypothetical protein